MVKIAVIGAGINGLASAVRIKESFKDFDVTLLSSEFSPDTTGDGSGGLWFPYLCGDTPEHLLLKWGSATYKLLHGLWLKGGCNICLTSIYDFSKEDVEIQRPEWASDVFGFSILDKKQLEYFSHLYNGDYRSGITFNSFVVHATSMIQFLSKRFKQLDGKIVQASVTSLRDSILDEYDVVVNCTGVAARYIVPDHEVRPIRGQISKVIAPWVNQVILTDTGNYIIPNSINCVLGGTHQEDDYNTQVDDKDTEFITTRCRAILPGLKQAKLVQHWVGLRPGRREVRLEAEEKYGRFYIHNYGHGGSGLTLFWGCAEDVVNILRQKLRESKKLEKSKL